MPTILGLAGLALALQHAPTPAVYEYRAGETLTPVELNHGDTLHFTLRGGGVRTIVLEDSAAAILERPARLPGLVYGFRARLRIDGHPLDLQRYVATQESFYEPWVVNGLRIWFDMALDTFRKIPERYPGTGHRRARPHKDARFALQDAALPLCPQEMRPWYPNERLRLAIEDCYNGEDCWMGPYLGQACHRGLDLNHAKGDPLWAPIDFDDQWLFHSVARGQDNNRWRGIRRWPNGDVWALQTHHLIRLHVPEHTPLRAGTRYADAAGVLVGSHHHTHFEFKIARPADGRTPDFDQGETLPTKIFEEVPDPRPRQPEVFHLDPWILFWQIFEAERDRRGLLRASFAPPGPARTGRAVVFSSDVSRPGKGGGPLRCFWSFGDGTGARGPEATHVFARPGIYPVTLVVEDGKDRASCTRHLTVDGDPQPGPALALEAPDEPSFRPRPPGAADVYGMPVRPVPFTLEFTARAERPRPRPRLVRIRNAGGGTLPPASFRTDPPGTRWLEARREGDGVLVSVDAAGLGPGRHEAVVAVDCPGTLHTPQEFRVVLDVRPGPPPSRTAIRDGDEGYFCTPWFWVGHRLKGGPPFYRTNGGRPAPGEFLRFTPDLAAGRYRVLLNPGPGAGRFDVRVRHRSGEETVRMDPARSRVVGTFDFEGGTDGWVEVLSERAEGLVAVESVVFEPAEGGPGAPR